MCVAFVPSSVYGDEWDKKTIFTFNAPVEVPGKVLTPGSYVFKLLNTPRPTATSYRCSIRIKTT